MKLIKYIIIYLLAVVYTATGQVTTPCVADTLQIIQPGVKGPDYGLPELDSPRISTLTAPEDYRMLYWVHGLNGNGSSWDKAATACEDSVAGDFKPREVYGHAPDYYESQSDIAAASWKFRQKLDLSIHLPPSYDRTKSFVIAHSQGGIVSRYTDYYYTRPGNGHERMFSGIVTFGTPNQGAQIVNNQGTVTDFLSRMADAMSAGPAAQFEAHDQWLARLIARRIKISELRETLVDLFSVHVGKYLINKSLPGITDQYKVGAPMLTDTLGVYESPSDLVAFYGVRDTLTYVSNVVYKDEGETRVIPMLPVPISWATVNYFLRSVNEQRYFMAQDSEFVWTLHAASARADYQAKVDHNEWIRIQSDRSAIEALLRGGDPYDIQLSQKLSKNARERRDAWSRGVRFIDNFDREYRVFVGSLKSEPESYTSRRECVCRVGNGRFVYQTIRYYPRQGEPCRLNYVPEMQEPDLIVEVECEEVLHSIPTGVMWRHKDSDGVVLAESAMNIPQHTFPPQPMEGSTHMGMRNDENTKNALKKTFEGGVGEFFRTKEKSE